jgi:hypothetical protein
MDDMHKITVKGGFHSHDTAVYLDDEPLMEVMSFQYSIGRDGLAECVIIMCAEVFIEADVLPERIKVTREQIKDFVPGGKFTVQTKPATLWQRFLGKLLP